jgi:uroporphyrinogen-III decarboxylase
MDKSNMGYSIVMAKTDIKSLIREYENVFAGKESRIRESLKRCTDALHFKNIDRLPVWQISQNTLFPRHELFNDPEKNFTSALSKNILSMQIESDFVPHLDPFEGVTILAEAFGCKTYVQNNGDPVVAEPIIKKAEDVYTIQKPSKGNPTFRRILETLKLWDQISGGIIPIGTTDPQSPLDVLELLWDTNDFYISLYEKKKEVHYLLNIITDTFIDFYSRQLDIVSNPAFPVHLFPVVSSNDGISVSDDQMINMSPELYAEFGVPSLNKVSKAFGGMYLHSCGNFMPFFKEIKSIQGLRAVNGHLSPKEITPESIHRILDSRIGLFIGLSDRTVGWDNPQWKSTDAIDLYHEYYLPSVVQYSDGTGVVLTGYGGYRGYFENPNACSEGLIVDGRGRPVDDDPFINIAGEQKDRNFARIVQEIERLQKYKTSQKVIIENDRYRRFSVK